MEVKIVRVTNSREMQLFLEVPKLVYGEGKVPPTASSTATWRRFSPLVNTVLQHVTVACFVAWDGERPVGRISASVDALNPRPEEGFWGCFECANDPGVAAALLNAAAAWLREKGKTTMLGPATLNTNEQVGLLVEGFEQGPRDDIPYNPPYYQELVEAAGLEKIHELECYGWRLPDQLPAALEKKARVQGVHIRPVNYRAPAEAAVVREIYNQSMARVWGFIPLTLSDARGFLSGLAGRVPPDLFLLVEVAGEPAGMLLAIPDGATGRLRLAVGGLVPRYQRRGIHWQGLKEFYRRCRRLGYTEGEVSQIAESNSAVKRKIIKPLLGGKVIKIYRVYVRKIN